MTSSGRSFTSIQMFHTHTHSITHMNIAWQARAHIIWLSTDFLLLFWCAWLSLGCWQQPFPLQPFNYFGQRLGELDLSSALTSSCLSPLRTCADTALKTRGSASVVQLSLCAQVVWNDVTCMLHCWGYMFSFWWRDSGRYHSFICMLRSRSLLRFTGWGRVCVCAHIALGLILTVGQYLFTCCHVLTCSCCRLIACCFLFSALGSKRF